MHTIQTALVFAGGFALASGALAFAADDTPAQQDPRLQEFREACSTDIATYCAGAQSRSERLACVANNSAKFSTPCRAFFAKYPPGATQTASMKSADSGSSEGDDTDDAAPEPNGP